jgi:hypothetical protein
MTEPQQTPPSPPSPAAPIRDAAADASPSGDRIVRLLRSARARLVAGAGPCAAESPNLLAAAVRLELGSTELTLAERRALDELLAAESAARPPRGATGS